MALIGLALASDQASLNQQLWPRGWSILRGGWRSVTIPTPDLGVWDRAGIGSLITVATGIVSRESCKLS